MVCFSFDFVYSENCCIWVHMKLIHLSYCETCDPSFIEITMCDSVKLRIYSILPQFVNLRLPFQFKHCLSYLQCKAIWEKKTNTQRHRFSFLIFFPYFFWDYLKGSLIIMLWNWFDHVVWTVYPDKGKLLGQKANGFSTMVLLFIG
jgi:hypothetical protein